MLKINKQQRIQNVNTWLNEASYALSHARLNAEKLGDTDLVKKVDCARRELAATEQYLAERTEHAELTAEGQ